MCLPFGGTRFDLLCLFFVWATKGNQPFNLGPLISRQLDAACGGLRSVPLRLLADQSLEVVEQLWQQQSPTEVMNDWGCESRLFPF